MSQHSCGLYGASESTLMLIDMQEKLLPVINDHDALLRSAIFVVEAAKLLQVPVHVSEQYPKGLGRTVPELLAVLGDTVPVEKTRFSAAEAFRSALGTSGKSGTSESSETLRRSVALIGIEAHICVQQTALELHAAGYRVSVIADAVGSRFDQDRTIAFERLRSVGVVVTTAESMVFEWCGGAEQPAFRSLSQLVRSRRR